MFEAGIGGQVAFLPVAGHCAFPNKQGDFVIACSAS